MTDVRLAKIFYRVAKMAVQLLEKEYGLGKSEQTIYQEIVVIKNNTCTTE